MKVDFTFKNVKGKDAIKKAASGKSGALEKYFNGKIRLHWHFTQNKNQCEVRCVLFGKSMDYFAGATGKTFLDLIEAVVDKLETQVRRHKEMIQDHKQGSEKKIV